MAPSIDLVVLTRQRRDDVVAALRSALPQLRDGDTATVLENGCPESSTADLETEFATVRFERSKQNLGVCGGRNRLIDLTSGDLIVFLDDDGEMQPDALEAIRRIFEDDAEIGAIAMRIDDPATGRPRTHEFPGRDAATADTRRVATYFVGAGFALRRAAVEQVGAFDEQLFYAAEELDLSYRLLDAGWRIEYLPGARVIHHASPAGRPAGQYFYFHLRNRFRVAVKNLPWRFAISHMVLWTGYFLVMALRRGRLWAALRGLAAGLKSLPAAVRARKPIAAETVEFLEEHDGRLWY